ncbi:MAG: hypothetical protein ABL962_17175, partial [Fimbriimonadaceae bacterium]
MPKEGTQGTLMQVNDVVLKPGLVREAIRANDHWVTDGHFMLARNRLYRDSFLTCSECMSALVRGQKTPLDLTADAAQKLFGSRDDESLVPYARTY